MALPSRWISKSVFQNALIAVILVTFVYVCSYGPRNDQPFYRCHHLQQTRASRSLSSDSPNISLGRVSTKHHIKYVDEDSELSNEHLSQEILLNPELGPKTVFYVWCGNQPFEFRHYLSVKSVLHNIRPDNVIFYYAIEPVMDKNMYHTWFQELIDKYPFFKSQQMYAMHAIQACDTNTKPDLRFIFNQLSCGGMYVNEQTIIPHFPLRLRTLPVVNALNVNDYSGLLMTKRGYPEGFLLENIQENNPKNATSFSCVSDTEFVNSTATPLCINLRNKLNPEDIWSRDDKFGRLVRKLFYGKPEISLPVPDYSTLVPNIAHMVWLGGGEMDMLFFLSVLSCVHVAQFDMVYIHGDSPPSGKYWNMIKSHPKVKHVYRENLKSVYNHDINIYSHVSDVWRADFMVKYGGVYIDVDAVFIKPLDKTIRAYDAVGSYDWPNYNPFPNVLNLGVLLGKKNAKFWRLFQESMKWFVDNDRTWNGLRQPYRILERHPDLIKIDPRLQVICYQGLCHPTWWPDYHNKDSNHLTRNFTLNWQNDTYVFHFTHPYPKELESLENMFSMDTLYADIFRFVLERAGLLDKFKQEVVGKKKHLSLP